MMSINKSDNVHLLCGPGQNFKLLTKNNLQISLFSCEMIRKAH